MSRIDQIRNRDYLERGEEKRLEKKDQKAIEKAFDEKKTVTSKTPVTDKWDALNAHSKRSAGFGEPFSPRQALDSELTTRLEHMSAMSQEMTHVENELGRVRKDVDAKQHETLKKHFEQTQSRLQKNFEKVDFMARETNRMGEIKSEWTAARERPSQQFSLTQTKSMSAGRAQPGVLGTQIAQSKAVTLPPGWGSETSDIRFPSDAFIKTMHLDNLTQDAFGDALQNSNRGREMMLLFHYLAQRAASGDIGAMYEFMKFVGYIISKDKAKELIQDATQMMKMQEQEREANKMIYDFNVDPNDPASSMEYSKRMIFVKQETDSINTNMKLLGQKMEVVGQTVEVITNMVQNLLEVKGRVERKSSGGA